MAPTKLKAELDFIDVAAGATVALPHGLNVLGRAVIPDLVFPPNDTSFEAVAGDATNLSVRNNSAVVASCSVQCWYWHSENRALGVAVTQFPSPPHFVGGGGGQGATNNLLVFRPGGVQAGNVYTDWQDMATARAGIPTPATIIIDDSLAPCVVPAGGPYVSAETTIKGLEGVGIPTVLTIADGATFTRPPVFANIFVLNESTTSPIALQSGDAIRVQDTSDISCAIGAAPMFNGSGLGAGEYAVLDLCNFGSFGAAVANTIVLSMSAAAADLLFVQIGERSTLGSNTIENNAAGSVQIVTNSTSGFLLEQGSIAGALEMIQRGYPQFNQVPGRGVAPAIANMGNQVSGSHLRLNATAGTFTQNMPEIAHLGISTEWTTGRTCIISETSGINGITLDAYLAETINGAVSYFLPAGATMMFISDGVSNWTSVSIANSVAGVAGDFVFRPGGVESPQERIFTTWAGLMTALDAVDSPQNLAFDDSIVSPCIVPAGGPYDMTDVTWRGSSAQYTPSSVEIADGATFTKLLTFDNVRVDCVATSPPCSLDPEDRIVVRNKAWIECSAAADHMYDAGGLTGGDEVALWVFDESIVGSQPAQPVINMDNAGGDYLDIYVGPASYIYRNAITSNAASDILVNLYSTTALWFDQANIAGGLDFNAQGNPQFNLRPPRSDAPETSNVSDVVPGDWVRLNANGGSFTQSLPDITPNDFRPLIDGRMIIVSETDGTNGVTVDANGAETIDGVADYALPPGATVAFISDGVSNWTSFAINANAILNRTNTFTKAQGVAQANLIDNVLGVAVDAEDSNVFFLQLTVVAGNTRQLNVPTNLVPGFTYMWVFRQPAAGGEAVTFPGIFWFPDGVDMALSGGANAVDNLTCVAIDLNPGGAPNVVLLDVSQLNYS